MDLRLTMLGSRSARWIACLCALLTLGSARAEAPTIRDKTGRLWATVVPTSGWCGSVVSVDIHGSRNIFEHSPVEVQEFIGATRGSIVEDCPIAELFRLHGFVDDIGVFQAFTAKSNGWRIQVFAGEARILPMLRPKEPDSLYSEEFAYFESRTQLDRARLPNVVVDPVVRDSPSDHVAWRAGGVEGFTYALLNRMKYFASLGAFADSMAHVIRAQCSNRNENGWDNPGHSDREEVIQTRTVQCEQGGRKLYIGVVAKEVDNVATIFLIYSIYPSVVAKMEEFISDKDIAY
jgi:hypothetical protein